ncbi:MAG: acylphosphatase [Chloroflexota bacterium]
MDENKRLHATVQGRVQGVGFRYYVLECANRLALNGWVRNRFNGDVEVVAEGPQIKLDTLAEALERGSRSSNVTRVNQQIDAATGEFDRFRIRVTG